MLFSVSSSEHREHQKMLKLINVMVDSFSKLKLESSGPSRDEVAVLEVRQTVKRSCRVLEFCQHCLRKDGFCSG